MRAPAVTWGIHTHNDADLAVANSMAAVAAGIRHVQATINGYGERCRQREHGLDPGQPGAQDAARAGSGGWRRDRAPDGPVAVDRRDRQPEAERLPALRRPVCVRPQGRRPRRGGGQGRAELPARRADGDRQRRPARRLGAGRRANTRIRAEQLGHQLDGVVDARALPADQAAGERGPRLRGRRGIVRAADPPPRSRATSRPSGSSTSPSSSSSATAASCWRRRRSRSRSTARCSTRPPTATARQRARRRAAQGAPGVLPGDRRGPPVDYKVRILDGDAATAARTRVVIDSAGRRPDLVDDGLRHEHHRGLRDRPGRLARVRDLEVRRRAAPPRRAALHDDAERIGRVGNQPANRGGDRCRRTRPTTATPTLHLARWTVTSGQPGPEPRRGRDRRPGDHQWEASAEGNGAVDALFRAVDQALADVLTGHPRLARVRRPRGRRGPRRRGRGDGPDRAAGGRRRRARDRRVPRRGARRRTSSRRPSTRTSRRSTSCWPRSTGRAPPRRPAIASGRRKDRVRPGSSRRARRGSGQHRHDGVVQPITPPGPGQASGQWRRGAPPWTSVSA